MTIGYDSAFVGGTIALASFKDEFHFERLSKSQINLLSANIVSCYQAGAFFGAFFAYPFGHVSMPYNSCPIRSDSWLFWTSGRVVKDMR